MISWFKKLFIKPKALSYCVPEAIYCAWLWAVKRSTPVRIAVSQLREGIDHCQAQALVDGEWIWLTPDWDSATGRIAVVPWTRHFDVEPYRYLTLREWIDEQIQYTEQ